MKSKLKLSLKGQCHEFFCSRFFPWNIFPQAPENNTRVISNFFENSQRYSQVKETDSCKKPEVENLVVSWHCPFKPRFNNWEKSYAMCPALVGLIVLYVTSISCTSVIRLRFQAGTSNRICSFGFLKCVYVQTRGLWTHSGSNRQLLFMKNLALRVPAHSSHVAASMFLWMC